MCVAGLTVFVKCLVKQFAILFGVVVILLLNVMDVLRVLCWIDRVWFSKECACCARDLSVHLDVHVRSNLLISEFETWITGICYPHIVFCVILYIMWSGKGLQLLWISPVGILCLSIPSE